MGFGSSLLEIPLSNGMFGGGGARLPQSRCLGNTVEKFRLIRSGGALSFVRWKMWASVVGSLQKAAAAVYVFAWASPFVGGWFKGVVAHALPTSTLL